MFTGHCCEPTRPSYNCQLKRILNITPTLYSPFSRISLVIDSLELFREIPHYPPPCPREISPTLKSLLSFEMCGVRPLAFTKLEKIQL